MFSILMILFHWPLTTFHNTVEARQMGFAPQQTSTKGFTGAHYNCSCQDVMQAGSRVLNIPAVILHFLQLTWFLLHITISISLLQRNWRTAFANHHGSTARVSVVHQTHQWDKILWQPGSTKPQNTAYCHSEGGGKEKSRNMVGWSYHPKWDWWEPYGHNHIQGSMWVKDVPLFSGLRLWGWIHLHFGQSLGLGPNFQTAAFSCARPSATRVSHLLIPLKLSSVSRSTVPPIPASSILFKLLLSRLFPTMSKPAIEAILTQRSMAWFLGKQVFRPKAQIVSQINWRFGEEETISEFVLWVEMQRIWVYKMHGDWNRHEPWSFKRIVTLIIILLALSTGQPPLNPS